MVGDTPNLAARLQVASRARDSVICASTRRLTGGHFDYRDLGPVALKGWAEPVPVWQVLGTSGVESRFEAKHKTKLPPLFGREEEIELLLRRWRNATQGEGRVVVLTGEPGIGKSHIALALQRAAPERAAHHSCAISARRIIPTVRSSHSSANSNVLPGSSAATRPRRSCPSSKR